MMFSGNFDIYQAFPGYKDFVMTKSQNLTFAKGLTHDFSIKSGV